MQCQADESVKFFFKLPNGFKIPTPVGNYIPDWVVIFENDKKIYFVVETKTSIEVQDLRGKETTKISSGRKHIAVAKDDKLRYCVVSGLGGVKANAI